MAMLYAPSIVVLLAGAFRVVVNGIGFMAVASVLLTVALALHVRETVRRHD